MVERAAQWTSLQSLVRVQAERFSKSTGTIERETRYYISSLAPEAAPINRAIRQHWHIENKLHWVLDVGFHEDHSRKRAGHAAQNFSLINRIALNLLRQDKTSKRGIQGKRLKAGWDTRFVMVSSISVFGRDAAEPVRDDAIKNPETIYGQTKLASEHLLLWYAKKHGLDTRALRFTWVFGPGRTTGITALYSSLILDAMAREEAITVPNPDETGDWLYVKDAVKALWMLHQAKNPKQRIYNIAGGVHSIREVVEIARKCCADSRVTLGEGGEKKSPYPAAYDDSVARKEIGWQPTYDIGTAVREHIGTIREFYRLGRAGASAR
jgi:predicted transposase YbfD/YdcC